MLAFEDGNTSLPQLRVNGVYVGDGNFIQEMEDFGELDDVLQVCVLDARLRCCCWIPEIPQMTYLLAA